MAMLKTITPKSVTLHGARSATETLASYLKSNDGRSQNASRLLAISRYLAFGQSGRDDRIVLHDHSDDILTDDTREWVREFILVKEAYHQLSGIPYYHFIISPDPNDKVSAQECLALAREWMSECYPDAQWFAAIHDDNANHITHAHIVVNSVLPSSGKKIHRTKRDIDREAQVLQRLCESHSLTPLPDLVERRKMMATLGSEVSHAHAKSAENAERAIVARGGKSYKAAIRDAINEAARKSYSWQEFTVRLADFGVTTRRTRKGVTYIYENWEGNGARRVPSSKLGKAYTESGVLERLGYRYDAIVGVRDAADAVSLRPMRKAYILASARISYKRARPQARHRGPDGRVKYETLDEVLVTRVARNRRRREFEEIISTLVTLQKGGYSSMAELRSHMEDVAEMAATADMNLDELERTDEHLTKMLQMMLGMDARKAELRRVEAKRTWNPTERARRKELREAIETDERWLSEQLDEAHLWAESRGISSDIDPQTLVADMLTETRAERAHATSAARREHEELDRLVLANRVMTELEGPHRELIVERRTSVRVTIRGGAPMRRGMELPAAEKAHYKDEDWQRLAESVGEQIGDSRTIAEASALVVEEERRRRAESDSWMRAHGIDPTTARPVDLVDSGRQLRHQDGSGRSRRSGDESPQQ